MSLGIKITMSGIVIFLFFLLMFGIGRQEPVTPGYKAFAFPAFIGLVAIPLGLLIHIWRG